MENISFVIVVVVAGVRKAGILWGKGAADRKDRGNWASVGQFSAGQCDSKKLHPPLLGARGLASLENFTVVPSEGGKTRV